MRSPYSRGRLRLALFGMLVASVMLTAPGESLAIIGGSAEPDAGFPWVVHVTETRDCGGVLIAPTWVLTAAHCAESNTRFRGARVSYSRTDPTTGVTTSDTKSTGQNSVFLHPDYVAGSADNDLALIRLPSAFNDPLVQPAELPTSPSATSMVGTIANPHSNDLELAPGSVKVVRARIFSLALKSFRVSLPTASMCEGDSGSGFVVQSDGHNVVTGIASQSNAEDGLGGPCEAPPSELTATDVYSHLDWIRPTAGIHNAQVYKTDGGGGVQLLKGYAWPVTWSLIVPGRFAGDGRTDAFFYDGASGAAEFERSLSQGNFAPVRQYASRPGYDIVVPGDFGRTSPTDLLFYDRDTGQGDFVTTDGSGNVTPLRSFSDWRTSWDQIVPGQFGGDGRTDLLFYDRAAGVGEFYTSTGSGVIAPLRFSTDWRTSWDIIVPGNFNGDSRTDLLFYDSAHGEAEVWTMGANGAISLLKQYSGFRNTWTRIVPGNFAGDGGTDLLFYSRSEGLGEFYRNVGAGTFTLLRSQPFFRTTWGQIVQGDFSSSSWADLLFYEQPAAPSPIILE
jgi:hypothetical protein